MTKSGDLVNPPIAMGGIDNKVQKLCWRLPKKIGLKTEWVQKKEKQKINNFSTANQ